MNRSYLPLPCLSLALAGVSLPLLAAEVPAVDSAANLGRTMLGLGVVIALVFGLAWVARRVSSMRALSGSGGGPIQVVGQLALGTRERLLLVEVDGKRVLLGVVPGAITRLDAGDSALGEGFSSRLSAAQKDAARRSAS
ncbi:flagellar biosynthetic protein FliO [Chromatocurvus halotolerans]|uniref:Flagellar protein n=1 Tax=Chromatocurvus halotolerans TaxID=1132028 RepID=A0A4R2KS48_9GAMM|nr:flagellar biosynthetic protein FliO [Chromatocurvus halotolerans]TCO76593.1 flagellar protein FliO/FliZ [Chromatocurvus halotolerans]